MDFALTLLWAAADSTTLSTILKITINIIYVILGVNALIIVHEFGHFAVARLCGVRCDKFYIWFDFWGLKFFKFRWGQTEYGLGVFPLGGYVKMLGQEDNPGELRAEMERAKARAAQDSEELQTSGEAESAETELPARSIETLQEEIFAPDSYLAKSVPQRMAIIVAGVVMNFLFAIVCAAGAYMYGIEETAPAVGSVIPGSPAWAADLRVGDRITSINDKPARIFTDINMAMVGGENGVKLTLLREMDGTDQIVEKTLIPRKRKNDLAPSIGVTSLASLDFASPDQPVYSWAKPFFEPSELEALKKPGMVVQSVEGVPVSTYAQFQEEQLKRFDQPVQCQFAPKTTSTSGSTSSDTVQATLPPVPMKEIGLRFQMGPVTMTIPDSDAQDKGIEPGDLILAVDQQTELDPLKLPQLILKKQNQGQESVEITVRKQSGEEKSLRINLSSVRNIPSVGPMSMKDPVGSSALGISWSVEPIVAGITERPDSYFSGKEELAQQIVGAKVKSVKFMHCMPLMRSNLFSEQQKDGLRFHEIGDRVDLPYIFDVMLQLADSVDPTEKEKQAGKTKETVTVLLELEKSDGAVEQLDLPILRSNDWFNTDRGLILKAQTATIKIDNFGEALSLGTSKMVEYSLSVFTFLGRLINGNVSPRALGGPVVIVQMAYMFVEKGFGSYLLFLCLIGANLAVINILPIPVLDGGHLVFLLYEGIFRKPPNENVQIILSYIGLFLILSLMVWALSLDLGCIKRI